MNDDNSPEDQGQTAPHAEGSERTGRDKEAVELTEGLRKGGDIVNPRVPEPANLGPLDDPDVGEEPVFLDTAAPEPQQAAPDTSESDQDNSADS